MKARRIGRSPGPVTFALAAALAGLAVACSLASEFKRPALPAADRYPPDASLPTAWPHFEALALIGVASRPCLSVLRDAWQGLSSPGARSAIVIAAIAFVLTGCATNHAMMPTPVLYTGENAKPLFTDLPPDSRRPSLDLLFITDRAPAEHAGDVPYTASRSHSMAFGSATIEFGKDVSWDVLVKESTATQRVNPVQLKLGPTTELGRFPAIPFEVDVAPDGMRRVPAVVEAYEKAKQQLQAEIARRIAIAHRKEVVLFVHGYHSSFESAALTMGELCHFLGRDFVCGIFTWPAGGRRGILFGYDDRPGVGRIRGRGPVEGDPDRRPDAWRGAHPPHRA